MRSRVKVLSLFLGGEGGVFYNTRNHEMKDSNLIVLLFSQFFFIGILKLKKKKKV